MAVSLVREANTLALASLRDALSDVIAGLPADSQVRSEMETIQAMVSPAPFQCLREELKFKGDERPEFPNDPFPTDISGNPLVVYHGTSSKYEASIERAGFIPGSSLFSRDEVGAVVDLYDAIGWSGGRGTAFVSLKPFSLDHDFAGGLKPVYFADTAYGALNYATNEFAGGEIARNIRCCMDELWTYATNPEVRERRADDERASRSNYERSPGRKRIGPSELQERLRLLGPLRERAWNASQEHESGVVYAVRLTIDDVSRVDVNNFMGIKAFHPIGPERIVAKARVPNGHRKPFHSTAEATITRRQQWSFLKRFTCKSVD